MHWSVFTHSVVSIHTPTQGVTTRIWFFCCSVSFNPHTHAGCDLIPVVLILSLKQVSIHTPTQGVTYLMFSSTIISKFQSTHPRRVWLARGKNVQVKGGFNPHTHAGCDWSLNSRDPFIKVSIHTPTQGVTIPCLNAPISFCFNPHTHAGCDL